MEKTVISTNNAPGAIGPYSQRSEEHTSEYQFLLPGIAVFR